MEFARICRTTRRTARRTALTLIGAAFVLPVTLTATLPTVAHAAKPVRMIVPNAAGSSADALARTVSAPLSKALGRAIVVENLPGAGGVPATGQLVRARKDGSTLAIVSNNHVVNPSLYKKMPFDSIKDITTISVIGGSPFVLVANPSLGVSNLAELIALAKRQPGKLTIGSSGNGTILHLAAEELQHQAGIQLKHIPYKGTGQMTTDLLGGQIQLGFFGVTGVAQQIKDGRLRAIGVSTPVASPLLPDVLPLSKQGLPNYAMQGWIALIGPAGLPDATVKQLSTELGKVLATPDVKNMLTAQGFTPIGSSPTETAAQFRAEMAKYGALVKQSGMTID